MQHFSWGMEGDFNTMNAKIFLALLCTTQLVAGFSFDFGSLTSALSDLQKKVQDVETNVVQTIQNAWNTVIAEAKQNMDNFKTQIETEVQKSVEKVRNATINISDCVIAEKENANKLIEDAKNELQAYADLEWSTVKTLISSLDDTVNKANSFIISSTKQIATCAANIFGSILCYGSLAGPIVQQAAEFGIDVANLVVQTENTFKIALNDLQTVSKTLMSQTSTQATAIITGTEQCIKTKFSQ